MDMLGNSIIVIVIVGVVVVLGFITMISKWYYKCLQGQALIKTGIGGTKVSFNGIMAIPILHELERIDISLKIIEIDKTETDKVICKDGKELGTKVFFYVRINKTEEDVNQVAQSMGCDKTFNEKELERLFTPKFSEAIKTVAYKFTTEELQKNRDEFRKEILNEVGTDLNGYCLDDAAIDYIERKTN